MTDYNAPTANAYHERPQWNQETLRGVIIRNEENVKLARDEIMPRVVLRGPMKVNKYRDYIVVGPIGSRNDFVTITFNPMIISVGCFVGSLAEFERELNYKQATDNNRTEYMALAQFLKILENTRA